jgi:hypothetical protein
MTCAADDKAIDRNVLLDILVPNEKFRDASVRALENAAAEGVHTCKLHAFCRGIVGSIGSCFRR